MTIKNRGIQRYIGLGLVAASFGILSGCGQIDVNTEEGLLAALEQGEKLDKAIPKISGMMARPEESNSTYIKKRIYEITRSIYNK